MWTQFMDMHSGGGLKESPYSYIYIEAPEEEAKVIFYNRFGHNPERVSCTCCGDDYSISEEESFRALTTYQRSCAYEYFYKDDGTRALDSTAGYGATTYDYELKTSTYNGREVEGRYVETPNLRLVEYGRSKSECAEQYRTVDQYLKEDGILVIRAEDIQDSERVGSIPAQGYVWMD